MRILAGGPTRETESGCTSEVTTIQIDGIGVDVWRMAVPDPGGPRWTHDKIARVAEARQEFLRHAQAYEAGFMFDADVRIGPNVLSRMLQVDADVVYGVYWTHSDWGGDMADWPQVWNRHPYGWTHGCWEALKDPGVNEVEVLGGGGCTLIRGRGFESHYWPLLDSLQSAPGMWCGEDRTFCLGLECRGIRQVAVTGLPIEHRYNG